MNRLTQTMKDRISVAAVVTVAAALVIIFAFTRLSHPASVQTARADYSRVTSMLDEMISSEMSEKGIPAISIALVDDQQIVWSKGFGIADQAGHVPASADTIYRVGSVSKLFTDIAIMRLVEQGKLDLDAPVTRYLPNFHPKNPFGKPITLRELMSHHSGLVRESPVGSYFDPTSPSLAATIASLNQTSLVYEPWTRTKYSNAAIATAGFVLEKTQKTPFADNIKSAVLDPLGMSDSSFKPTPKVRRSLAKGEMWTIDGRTFDAPTFELGIAPAGSMYTTVNDLGKFASALLAGGEGTNGRILKSETLEKMWTPQYAEPGQTTGFGIGFSLGHLDGHRAIGHGGAIYGFSTQLEVLPEDKLGVVVVASKDVTNAVVNHIADVALKAMLAVRDNKPVITPVKTSAIPYDAAKKIVGRYSNGKRGFDLFTSAGVLTMLPLNGGIPAQIRMEGDDLITDGPLGYGTRIFGGEGFNRVKQDKPPPAPAKWRGLIGEYGWDHDILYILERDGKLWALIEWIEFEPLEEVSANVYRFPDRGLYCGEQIVFIRDKNGKASKAVAAGVSFARRDVGPEGTKQLHIKPVRPVPQLLKEALAAKPPLEKDEFRKSDLVELTKLDPTIKLDIRYASTNNFLGSVFYSQPKAFMQRPAAEAVARANEKLRNLGYGLLIHDAYRPWYVTKVFWDATPDDKKIFVADPSQGSRHNRGMAVDLSLYDLASGEPIEMVGTYDETSDRSYPDYPGGTSLQRWHRKLLRDAMENEGFTVYDAEWWHFDFKDWQHYPIGNQIFEDIGK